MKKIISFLLCFLLASTLLFPFDIVSAKDINQDINKKVKNVSEKQLDSYLAESGYSDYLISTFDIDEKKDLYYNNAIFASSEVTYSILTESDNIPLQKDYTGKFQLVNKNDIEKINVILKDKSEENKIIENKNLYNIDGTVNLMRLSNFTSSLVSSYLGTYSGLVKYKLTYNWTWNYDPQWTLTDKIGFAWSDDFDAAYNTSMYKYTCYGRAEYGYGSSHKVEYGSNSVQNYKYNEYAPGSGIALEYDIIGSYNRQRDITGTGSWQTVSFNAYKHSGWASVQISKYSKKTGVGEQTGAVAKYFHKRTSVQGTVTFSPTPRLSITNSLGYDQSDDAAVTFRWVN
ncbi:MAG: hypothetical protein ACERKV_13185 [Clostridiaceae bacterium]